MRKLLFASLLMLLLGCEQDSPLMPQDPLQQQQAQNQQQQLQNLQNQQNNPANPQRGEVGNDQGGGNVVPGQNPNPAPPAQQNVPDYAAPQEEEVLPAENTKPSIPLRARKDDSYYHISNVQLKGDRFGRPTLYVDYELIRGGKYGGVSMKIIGEGNFEQNVSIIGGLGNKDTIEYTPQFRGPFGQQIPRNLEVYFYRGDHRWGLTKIGTFKVSNSAVMGNYPNITLARNWTQEEIDRFTSEPPNHTNPNAHTGIGTDTQFVGAEGGIGQRFVEPEGHLFGLEFRTGKWEEIPCIGGLTAVFNREQEKNPLMQRVLAKDGYAVGAVNVQTNKYVTALQLVFYKLNPDGSLNLEDTYTSSWFGHPDQDAQPETLGGDGRKVIGIHLRQGAITNAMALVMDHP